MPNPIAPRLTLADLSSTVGELDDPAARVRAIASDLAHDISQVDPDLKPSARDSRIAQLRIAARDRVLQKVIPAVRDLGAKIEAQREHFTADAVLARQSALDPTTRKPIRDHALDTQTKQLYYAEARGTPSAQILAAAERAVAEGDAAKFAILRAEARMRPRDEISSDARIRMGMLAGQLALPESNEGLALIDKAKRTVDEVLLAARELMRGTVDGVTRIRLGLEDQAKREQQGA